MNPENPFQNMNNQAENEENDTERKEKEEKLEKIRQDIEGWGDLNGMGIDEGIKETVIMCNALELPTSQSCEGHEERGLPAPWVDIEAENEPEPRFENEKETYEKIAKENNTTVEKIKKDYEPGGLYWKAQTEIATNNDETEEHKKWQKENIKLHKRVKGYLKEFYKDRSVKSDEKIKVDDHPSLGFRMHNGGENFDPVIEDDKKPTKEQIQKNKKNLKRYRAEMNEFSKFLENKYFEK